MIRTFFMALPLLIVGMAHAVSLVPFGDSATAYLPATIPVLSVTNTVSPVIDDTLSADIQQGCGCTVSLSLNGDATQCQARTGNTPATPQNCSQTVDLLSTCTPAQSPAPAPRRPNMAGFTLYGDLFDKPDPATVTLTVLGMFWAVLAVLGMCRLVLHQSR